jgi:hypothetical protein
MPLQAELLNAAEKGDVRKMQRCLAAGVSVNCKNSVGAPLRPMRAHTVGVPACSNS